MKKLILFLLINMSLLAQFAGGSGTTGDPYQIESEEQFDSIRYYLSSSFVLTDDIYFSTAHEPIGLTFTGELNGNNHKLIDYVSSVLQSSENRYYGIFMNIDSATIQRLTIENFSVNLSITNGRYIYAAILAGISYWSDIADVHIINSSLLIENDYANTDYASSTFKAYQGGIVGASVGGNITNCNIINTTLGQDYTTSTSGYGTPLPTIYFGGICGYAGSTTITKSGFYGNFQSEGYLKVVLGTGVNYTGGFIGKSEGVTIDNCWAIVANNYNIQTGIIGLYTLHYAGFIGGGNGTINHSYCYLDPVGTTNNDINVNWGYYTGQTFTSTVQNGIYNSQQFGAKTTKGVYASGAYSKTLAQMKDQLLYQSYGYDFRGIWTINKNYNNGYPYPSGNLVAFTGSLPPKPILIEPVDSAVAVKSNISQPDHYPASIKFRWYKWISGYADDYIIQIRRQSDNLLVHTNITTTTTETTYLEWGKSYRWRVGARNQAGTNWSAYFVFTVAQDPATFSVSLLKPAADTTGLTLPYTFKWADIDSANSYDFEIEEVITGNTVVSENVTDTSYEFSGSGGASTENIETVTYDNISFSVASQTTSPRGFHITNDYSKLLVWSQNDLYVYSLGDSTDISTASFSSAEDAVNTFHVRQFVFDDDYTFGYDNTYAGAITSFTFDTPGDFTNFTTAIAIAISEENQMRDFEFNDDFTKMWLVGTTNNTVYEYTLTSGDISTLSYTGNNFSLASECVNGSSDIEFNSDYTKMWACDKDANIIYQYSLDTEDITTLSYGGISFSLDAEMTSIQDFTIDFSQKKLWAIDWSDNAIYQYSITTEAGASNVSNTKYKWQVQANATSDTSGWKSRYFTTALGATVDTVVFTNPSDGDTIVVNQEYITWNWNAGWDSVRIQVEHAPSQTKAVDITLEYPDTNYWIAETRDPRYGPNYGLPDGFSNYTEYRYRGVAYSGDTNSVWTDYTNFFTSNRDTSIHEPPNPDLPVVGVVCNFWECDQAGDGSKDDPYLISTAEQLDSVRWYGCGENKEDVFFKMVKNIDMENYTTNWQPIGISPSNIFTANFDGDGYAIKNLKKVSMDQSNNGLFGDIGYASSDSVVEIKNLILYGFDFNFTSNTANTASINGQGLLFGRNHGIDTVKNIIIYNSRIAITTGINMTYAPTMGILGGYGGGFPISRCGIENSEINVVNVDQCYISGVVGLRAYLSQCYMYNSIVTTRRTVSIMNTSGMMYGDYTINDCYFYGGEVTINYTSVPSTLFLSGINQSGATGAINNTYFAGKIEDRATDGVNLFTEDTGTDLTNCIADTIKAEWSYDSGIGLNKSDSTTMRDSTTYINLGWDFDNVWTIDTTGVINDGYPYLQWREPGAPLKENPLEYETEYDALRGIKRK